MATLVESLPDGTRGISVTARLLNTMRGEIRKTRSWNTYKVYLRYTTISRPSRFRGAPPSILRDRSALGIRAGCEASAFWDARSGDGRTFPQTTRNAWMPVIRRRLCLGSSQGSCSFRPTLPTLHGASIPLVTVGVRGCLGGYLGLNSGSYTGL
jgi:hypothetical protein